MILSADMSIMLDRILDAATDNLRFAKILVQMGLDPNNVTWDAIFNRLLEIFLHLPNGDGCFKRRDEDGTRQTPPYGSL